MPELNPIHILYGTDSQKKDQYYYKMLESFCQSCRRDGLHPSVEIIEELSAKMIESARSGIRSPVISFRSCNVDDVQLSYLLDAFSLYPVLSDVIFSDNNISNKGVENILRLLRAQIELAKKINIDNRLNAIFVDNIHLDRLFHNIHSDLLDELNMLCEVLNYANSQVVVRKIILRHTTKVL